MSVPATPEPAGADPRSCPLTREELALLRASLAFNARHVTDPVLRARLESAALKLNRLAETPQAA